jgi:hypothetical protein
MRIEEGEGGILCQCDALSGRLQRVVETAGSGCEWRRQRHDDVEVERALDHVGQPVEMRHQILIFAGLDEAEMALRQIERGIAQDRADHRQADRLDRVAAKTAVTFAAQPVEHDAGHAHITVIAGKTLGDGCGRSRLSGNVEHQQHRQAVEPGEIGGRAGAARGSGNPVEQAHGAFEEDEIGIFSCVAGQRVEQSRRHRPAVEIDAGKACRGGVEAWVDIVGAGFGAAHLQAAPGERAQYTDGDAGLARA